MNFKFPPVKESKKFPLSTSQTIEGRWRVAVRPVGVGGDSEYIPIMQLARVGIWQVHSRPQACVLCPHLLPPSFQLDPLLCKQKRMDNAGTGVRAERSCNCKCNLGSTQRELNRFMPDHEVSVLALSVGPGEARNVMTQQ